MLAVLLALMRYEKIVAGIGLGIVCFVVVAALGCIVYEVVKAHGSLSTALADAKAAAWRRPSQLLRTWSRLRKRLSSEKRATTRIRALLS